MTGLGRVGGPGVSAQRPALLRMESLGRNLGVASALRLNMEGNLARESLETRKLATIRTVLWTATGATGVHGEPAARLVEKE